MNAAIEELGFVRNRQASALRGGQSGVVGLIVRDLSAPFYAELTAGLTEALEAQGRMVFLLHGGKDGEQLTQRFSLLLNQASMVSSLPVRQGAVMTCGAWQKKKVSR